MFRVSQLYPSHVTSINRKGENLEKDPTEHFIHHDFNLKKPKMKLFTNEFDEFSF